MKKAIFYTLIFGFCLCSCKQNPKTVEAPEEVARRWQKLLDNNQFNDARKISTKRAQDMVNLIESMIFESEEDASLNETQFLEMNCQENGKTASCSYIIEENGERITDSFLLIKKDGLWLVDIPEEASLLNDDPMDAIFKEYENALNQALEKK